MKYNFAVFFLILSLVSFASSHGHVNETEIEETFLTRYWHNLMDGFTKYQQANIGAFIISSAPIPIFIIIVLFNIKKTSVLDVMSAFAAGAWIGDVFWHNFPEIMEIQEHKHSHDHGHKHGGRNHSHNEHKNTLTDIVMECLTKNEMLICWGILLLFLTEKIISHISSAQRCDSEEKEHLHSQHGHGHTHINNIVISWLGDFIHNVTDGMAIGAGFNKGLNWGITLSISIFFHEIPHEVGDFSYLLKQNMSVSKALSSQLFSALGAFVGVYISFFLGEVYSDKIISFASGAFWYLAINTIMGDLKETKAWLGIIWEGVAFVFGVVFLSVVL